MGNKPTCLIYDIASGKNKVVPQQGAGTDTQQGAWLLPVCIQPDARPQTGSIQYGQHQPRTL